MKVKIYALINPNTNEVIYVGQTTKSLEERLKSHYWKLNEAKRGGRTMTTLFKFLDSFLPNTVIITLLKEVDNDKLQGISDYYERYYINYYRNINPNLLNEANGGIGGNTYANKSDEEKRIIGTKISNKNKGRKKPEGFASNLSVQRMGGNNPMARKFERKIGAYINSKLVKSFDYSFEINEFIGSKSAGRNVTRQLRKNSISSNYGYIWKYIE